ncbi:SRP72 domain-containing protein [Mycena sanguinolenta]|uniref:Signal recognition particle subunit SRP72 n=1 Tax=Mycena sanguinolenta TaxID=230812 RepID=A0A8H6XDZ4_9AGAR|nr:SRP72 domain-containing protein [Mycena sanguinolenta]
MPAPKSKSSGLRHESKPKTREERPIHEQLKRLFKTLCAQIDGGHHSNAIKTCDKILRLSPADADALQTKLFLLLTTDQAAAAITLIESLKESNELRYTFEQAYALYCLHKRDEARAALSQEGEGVDERGARHLEAQLNYREGAYQAAFDIYNELLDSAPTAEEHADILTNIQAVSAHLDFINTTFLHSLDALPTSVQAQIEDAPPPTVAATHAPLANAAVPESQAPPKEKKVRLPKGVVLGVTPMPDPERWLKKSERSNFGQRRRKGAGGGRSDAGERC